MNTSKEHFTSPTDGLVYGGVPRNMPDDRVTHFHEGQVWETPRGYLHKCVCIEGKKAIFRASVHGNGRKTIKAWDGVGNWVLYYDPEYPA